MYLLLRLTEWIDDLDLEGPAQEALDLFVFLTIALGVLIVALTILLVIVGAIILIWDVIANH